MILAAGGWGALGSVLDSILGACLQASVVDKRSGKVVEATNGGRVLITSSSSSSATTTGGSGPVGRGGRKVKTDNEEVKGEGSRILGTGRDILDNNQVNFLMAGIMTVGGMVLVGRAWEVDAMKLIWSGVTAAVVGR